ncbi:RICIN domain-containing protein [Streptomyces morookaense]|uniref:RICIN domain-containing protein n=1 Tax=Streptomyces morookaense TaxID=1970 RepID=UPI0033D5A9EA
MVKRLRSTLAVCVGAAVAMAAGTTAANASPRFAEPTPAGTVVNLQLAGTDMCLDILGNPTADANGAKAAQWSCDGSDTQKWRMLPVDNSSFELRSVHSDKCLEIENSGTQEGADAQIWACSGGKQMRWQASMVDPVKRLYEFRVTHTTERCLDISNSGFWNGVRTNGVRAQSWACNQSGAQLWQIKAVK